MTKVLKTSLAMLLAFVMLIGALPFSVSAATPSMIISVSTKNAMAGQTVDLDVMVKDNPGVAAISLDIDYDKDNLTLTGFTYNTEALVGAQTTPYNESASIPTLYMVNGTANITGDFKLATLTFAVKESAKNNVAAYVRLSYDPDNIYDITETNIDTVIENGAINIIACVPGDINGDEKVNSKDVSRLMQYHAHWNVDVNEPALDTNGDGKLNSKDVTRLMQYIAHYDVEIYPQITTDEDKLTAVAAIAATCQKEGNIAFWINEETGKYYKDAKGLVEITQADTVIPKVAHTIVTDAAIPATYDSTGLTEGSHCSVCNEVLVAQEVTPKLKKTEYSITYYIALNDTYLQSIEIDNPNLETYTSQDGYINKDGGNNLEDLMVDGYTFEGWYDAPGSTASKVTTIPKGSTGPIRLYARWSQEPYDITYKLYQTPLQPISDQKYLHYTTGKGLADLPNPTLYNYIFLGWYTDDGKEVTEIPAGTTGDITLNAYWTSKRNLAKRSAVDDQPIRVENIAEGVVYFAYEIGTIENVPLTDAIWTIQGVQGLSQKRSETVTKQITQSNADTIAKTISNATVDSGTWTLSESWNENTSVTEQWAEQHGMTVEEANSYTKTSSNTTAFTSSNGGTSSQVDNSGTSTLGYNSKSVDREKGVELGVKASYTSKIEGKTLLGGASAEVGLEGSAQYNQSQKTNKKTGSDTTTLDTHTHTEDTNWNSSSSSSSTNTASQTASSKRALSDLITNTKGYGKSYSKGGGSSETQGFSSTNSESVNSSTTITYTTADIETTTTEYSTDGKSEGCYRLVIAGTMHVFGVVGYDVGSQSFFTYTFNVMDDDTYEFLDYSSDLKFNDNEYGCIPFEIPDDIYNYVCANTCYTEGLIFRTNTTDRTATVSRYTGEDQDVLIPAYITSGGTAYRVTAIAPTAFAGKSVRAIKLSRFIEEIPASSFSGCNSLEEISGYFTRIGNNAFDGCTSLSKFTVPSTVTEIGSNAFNGVGELIVNVMSKDEAIDTVKIQNPQNDDEDDEAYADRIEELAYQLNSETANTVSKSAIASGADRVILNLDKTFDGVEYVLEVPEMDYFAINGGKKAFKNFKLKSNAEETALSEMYIKDCTGIPLEIHSDVFSIEAVNVISPSFSLLLSKDGAVVDLKRDNTFTSNSNKALVCKNPTFVSIVSGSTDGILDINGSLYLCGAIEGEENLTLLSGDRIPLTTAEFEKYIKGFYTVTFNPNGGTVNTETKELLVDSKYGDLPTPSREGFDFLGWYDGDTKVDAESVFTAADDLVLKAHWLSNWVLESNAPSDAEVDENKWSYDLTSYTTSSSSSLSGWTQYDSSWVWGNYGNWSSWSRTQYYSSDSRKIETRTVQDSAAYTSYTYSIYRTSDGWGYGTKNYYTGSAHGSCTVYDSVTLTYSLPVYNSSLGTYGPYNSSMFSHSGDSYWFYDGSEYHAAVNHTEWRYADRSKVYTYYFKKVDSKESTSDPTGQTNVSNVQKWVKYIIE